MRFFCALPLLALLAATSARGQVVTESVRVRTTIVDGAADTRVALRLRNDSAQPGEKVLVLPLPEGATADRLEMTVDGRRQVGEVLDKDRARRVYESIVRQRLDPALLEYAGLDTLQLNVFPVPPRGHQDVEIRFRMLLPETGGLFAFEFPARALEESPFSVEVTIESRLPIQNVYSPLQRFDIVRPHERTARASYESKVRPPRDPVLFYALCERDFGLHLVTYRRPGEDGYYLLMLAPKRESPSEKPIAKAITFVVDTSGSMEGEKIAQARNALRFFLASLRPGDRFNLIPFATEARPFAAEPVEASGAEIAKAQQVAAGLVARGGTNLEQALVTALRSTPAGQGLPIVVLLTDGQPTVGQQDVQAIVAACQAANAAAARVFVLGVGHDVNTFLLDTLADRTKGTRDYVEPGEDLEIKTSALFEKLAHPALTHLALRCDGVAWSQVVPNNLPDLFHGSRLVVAGRYRGDGKAAIRLEGRIGPSPFAATYDATFPAEALDHDFVATLWAQRQVGQLLDAIRLNGSGELVAEVRRLGTEHGLVTPYSSSLVVEDAARVAGGGRGGRTGGPGGPQGPRSAGPSTPAPGGPASDDFVMGRGYGGAQAGAAAVRDSTEAARRLYLSTLDDMTRRHATRRIGSRSFHLVGGVWIDTAFRKELDKKLRRMPVFSADYFELLRREPELAQVFALGTAIVVVVNGQAIEIVPEAKR